jgi:hypothetical protein
MPNESRRFGQYPNGGDKPNERATDYSKDPKFNKAAAIREEFDFYAKMAKTKGVDSALQRGEQSRHARGH